MMAFFILLTYLFLFSCFFLDFLKIARSEPVTYQWQKLRRLAPGVPGLLCWTTGHTRTPSSEQRDNVIIIVMNICAT